MNPARRLSCLERHAAGPPAVADPQGNDWATGVLDRPTDEARELARATTAAFAEMVGQYREHWKLSTAEAVARAEENTPATIERILHAPPDQVSWFDIDTIGRHDPEDAQRRWEEIKEAARGELRTGERAAEAVNGYSSTCWSKAQFLAVRQELIESLGSRNAAELLLIDQMATFQTQLWSWQQTLTSYASIASLGSKETIKQRGAPGPPRMTDAEAMEQAAAMVERFQRMFHRSLAAFQAQRRQAPVVVRRAGQVNVAQNQQINLTRTGNNS